jgi:hypothetical protein
MCVSSRSRLIKISPKSTLSSPYHPHTSLSKSDYVRQYGFPKALHAGHYGALCVFLKTIHDYACLRVASQPTFLDLDV